MTSNVAVTSVYASTDAADPARPLIVAINKTAGPLTAAVTLAAYADYPSVAVWQLTGPEPERTAGPGVSPTATNAFLYAMPAYSVSMLAPQ